MKNKIILITGGATGIGFALAKALCNDNTVISIDRNEAKIEKLKAALPKVESIKGDVTSNDDLNRAIAEVEKKHSKIDVLINNAGKGNMFNFPGSTEQQLLESISMEMNINYTAPIMLSKKALPLLKKSSSPTIVVISSGLAYLPIAMLGSYCASKSAIHFVTMSMRHQLAETKIRVVEVLPPVVDTEMGTAPVKKMKPDDFAKEMLTRIDKGQDVLNIGQTSGLEKFVRFLPKTAFKMLNKPVAN
jgi:uncharacterized oxidoreductase